MDIERYLGNMKGGTMILWCYLLWYLTMLVYHFDHSFSLWGNSLGISLIVGFALLLSTGPITRERLSRRFWESLRLCLCPFLVSSFTAFTKGEGFWLLLSPVATENLTAATVCAVFVVLASLGKMRRKVVTSS